jgi:ribosome biogenesis GTPase YqeH
LNKKCSGCGANLQYENPNEIGYVPEKVAIEQSQPLCQRCFKIKNYGSYIPVDLDKEFYKNEVRNVIKDMDAILLILDIIEFESSFDKEILSLLKNKKFIIAVNKIDLIPGNKHASEISEWIKMRLFKEGLEALDIAILSTHKNYGVNGIFRKFKHFYPNGAKIAIIGATNVGKSSLINKLFGDDRATISKYPGTTLKTVKHTKDKFVFFDTPGIIPKGRLSDLVCEKCNLDIVPSSEISRKTFKLGKDRVLFLGGLAYIKILKEFDVKPIFSVYLSKNVVFHETNKSKIEEIIKKHSGNMLTPPCNKCKTDYYNNKFKTQIIEIEDREELVIKGLGWLTVKRGPLIIELTMPESVEYVIREAFIEPKRAEDMF